MKRTTLRICVLGAMGIMMLIMFPACILPDCTIFRERGAPKMVSVTMTQVTLAWDASPSTVDHYTVYFRMHGTSDWVALADVPADPQPEYQVAHSTVGDGEFDFAVVAVDESDLTSDYHTSLDPTAEPEEGWYLSWYVE